MIENFATVTKVDRNTSINHRLSEIHVIEVNNRRSIQAQAGRLNAESELNTLKN